MHENRLMKMTHKIIQSCPYFPYRTYSTFLVIVCTGFIGVLAFFASYSCGDNPNYRTYRSQNPPGDLRSYNLRETYDAVRNFAGEKAALLSIKSQFYVGADNAMNLVAHRDQKKLNHAYRNSIAVEYSFVHPYRQKKPLKPQADTGNTGGTIGERVVKRVVNKPPPAPFQRVIVIVQHDVRSAGRFTRHRINRRREIRDMVEIRAYNRRRKGRVLPPPRCSFPELWKQISKRIQADKPPVWFIYDRKGYTIHVAREIPMKRGKIEEIRWERTHSSLFNANCQLRFFQKKK